MSKRAREITAYLLDSNCTRIERTRKGRTAYSREYMLTCRQRLELMRHVYNEDSSPSTPEAKEDIFQCLTVYSNPKFSLANLLPSRLVLERARLFPLIVMQHALRPRRVPLLRIDAKVAVCFCRFFSVLSDLSDLSVFLRGFLGNGNVVLFGAARAKRALALGARNVSMKLHDFFSS